MNYPQKVRDEKADGCNKVPSTWGPVVQEGVSAKELSVVPFDVDINYDYWGYREFLPVRVRDW